MVSGVPSQSPAETDVSVLASVSRSCLGKKNQGKVPKKIHKTEREKLKREHLNDLFLDLPNALELKEPNNGKASTLSEANRLLKDLCGQIECLRKEHAMLLSESRYVDIERNELQEETSALASQIEKLQSELQSRSVHSKPDLNIPPICFPTSAFLWGMPWIFCYGTHNAANTCRFYRPHAVRSLILSSSRCNSSPNNAYLTCKQTACQISNTSRFLACWTSQIFSNNRTK